MQSVRMHLDGTSRMWAMAKCRVCGEVHKYLVGEALAGPVKCKSCARPMEIQGAVVEKAQPGDSVG